MRLTLALLLIPLLLGAAPAVSPEEATQLAAREMVVRSEPSEQGQSTVVMMDVAAPPERLLDAVIDLEARAREIGSLHSVSVYLREPERIGAQFDVRVLGTSTVFHVLYEIDRVAMKASYRLDASRENELDRTEGVYEVHAIPGGSRLVYRSAMSTGSYVPGWLRDKMMQGPLVEQMTGIRTRAEAGPPTAAGR